MTEDHIVQRIRERIKDPGRVTSMSLYMRAEVYLPAPLDLVRDAETRLGFRLPELLVRLYTEIGNGGFGPGYGLYGLEGGLTSDYGNDTIPELYLSLFDVPGPPYWWPERVVPICDGGGCMESGIDCSTPEGRMVFFPDDGRDPVDEEMTFAQWMEDWINDIDLEERGRTAKRQLSR